MERLEERFSQGYSLNADQQAKAARLGPSKRLRTRMESVEARIAKVGEGGVVSSSESDSEEECQAHPFALISAVNSSIKSEKTGLAHTAPTQQPSVSVMPKASGEQRVTRRKEAPAPVPVAPRRPPVVVTASASAAQVAGGKKNSKAAGGKHNKLGAGSLASRATGMYDRVVFAFSIVFVLGLIVAICARCWEKKCYERPTTRTSRNGR
jgi:hypothetical protein